MKWTILTLWTASVLFHEGVGGGALAGILHPLLGYDHLLAMVTVGLLSAQLGGKAIWSVPTTFVSVMALGGVLGLVGFGMPWVEYGISFSVLILGIAVAAKRNLPITLVMGFVGFFALFHGHAHGSELPELSDTYIEIVMYVFGFLVATAGLHLIGALTGQIAVDSHRGSRWLQITGVFIAAAGVWLLLGV